MSQLPDNNNWFTEVHTADGSAFSFKLTEKGRLHEEQTPFQKIEVYDTETFGKLMVIDGYVMLTTRDNFLYHEMMSHPALYTHPNPERVLIIGGGDCGTLREVLRHPGVKLVQQVDIDEGVTRAAEKYFPELCESNDDPRAELHFADGLKWVKEAEPGSYDLIIVDSTDPVGPAEGLFSQDFFQDCHHCLAENGMVVQQSESPLYHLPLIKDMYSAMGGAGFVGMQTLPFPQPVYPSGWWSCTMAFKGMAFKNADAKDIAPRGFREKDSENRSFETLYYTTAIHRGALDTPPFMKKALTGLK